MLLPIFLLSILACTNAWIADAIKKLPNFVLDPLNKIPELLDVSDLVDPPEDATLTVMELISKYGYNGELHKVTTSDGYILELHRITGRANSTDTQVKKPIAFVMHGLLGSSAVWVFSGAERSFAFILADAGYDVWLGNARGTVYAREHENPKIKPAKYWDFSWHEIGMYDLPAMIDYTLETTGQEDLFYLGHSQGTTSFFVMASERPEYQKKIKAMFAMAPIAYCGRMKSPFIQLLAQFTTSLDILSSIIGLHEFKPSSDFMKAYQQLVCSEKARTQPICSNIMFLMAGFNPEQLDMAQLPVILGHCPAGASAKQFAHYLQLIKTGSLILPGKFKQYNHGKLSNRRIYGSITPPSYNIKNIKVPITVHYSKNDWMAHTKDVEKLYSELPNTLGKFLVPDNKFNHLDFMWAKNAKEVVYDPILSQMEDLQK